MLSIKSVDAAVRLCTALLAGPAIVLGLTAVFVLGVQGPVKAAVSCPDAVTAGPVITGNANSAAGTCGSGSTLSGVTFRADFTPGSPSFATLTFLKSDQGSLSVDSLACVPTSPNIQVAIGAIAINGAGSCMFTVVFIVAGVRHTLTGRFSTLFGAAAVTNLTATGGRFDTRGGGTAGAPDARTQSDIVDRMLDQYTRVGNRIEDWVGPVGPCANCVNPSSTAALQAELDRLEGLRNQARAARAGAQSELQSARTTLKIHIASRNHYKNEISKLNQSIVKLKAETSRLYDDIPKEFRPRTKLNNLSNTYQFFNAIKLRRILATYSLIDSNKSLIESNKKLIAIDQRNLRMTGEAITQTNAKMDQLISGIKASNTQIRSLSGKISTIKARIAAAQERGGDGGSGGAFSAVLLAGDHPGFTVRLGAGGLVAGWRKRYGSSVAQVGASSGTQPGGPVPVEMWASGQISGTNDNTRGAERSGETYSIRTGMSLRLSDGLTVGLAARYRHGDSRSRALATSLNSDFFGAGAFFQATLADALRLEGLVAYEHGRNSVSISGATGKFGIDGVTVSGRLSRRIDLDGWWLEPNLGASYSHWSRQSYVNSAAVTVPGSTLEQGRLSFGPRIGRSFFPETASVQMIDAEIHVNGVYDFISRQDVTLGPGVVASAPDFGASAGGSLRLLFPGGVSSTLGFDYLGQGSLNAYTGRANITIPGDLLGLLDEERASLHFAIDTAPRSSGFKLGLTIPLN
ncbi:MAG: autotransporter domain-containing protein [Pseudomonadota bacterium]